jgi:nucleotide-binding universal stress UspA family protein
MTSETMPAIIACTDGSLYATSVYEHAAWAAAKRQLPVHVLHLVERGETPGAADLSGNLGFDAGDELLQEMVRLGETQGQLARLKSNAILEDAESRLAALGVSETRRIQRHGALVEALGEFQPESGLIVIGKRGEHADFARGHLGSNLERVIRAATLPVLIAARAFRPIERFVIAFDGGPSSLKAVRHLAESPLLKAAEGHLIAVAKPGSEVAVAAESAAHSLRGAGLTVAAEIAEGHVEETIAKRVTELGAQLLVMGAYGHSRIRRFVIGSTTTELIRTCHVPVLIIR